MQIDIRKWTTGWHGFLALCTAAWLLAACVTPAQAALGETDVRFADRGRLFVPGGMQAVTQQPDGKLLVVDWDGPTSSLYLRRYLASGQPDTGFGSGGRIEVARPFFADLDAPSAESLVAALQPDGKLVIGGSWSASDGLSGFYGQRFLIRLNPAQGGGLDPTFGTNGAVYESEWSPYLKLLVLPRGDIVALSLGTGPGQVFRIQWLDPAGQVVSTQVNSDVIDIAPFDASSVAVLGSGNGSYVSLLRDAGYDDFAMAESTSSAQRLAIDATNRIVTCGAGEVRRYLSNGAADTSFGTEGTGRVRLDTVQGARFGSCAALATDSSGGILAVGNELSTRGEEIRTFVLRLRQDGSLDPAVGTATAPATLRGRTPPAGNWQPLWLGYTDTGDARMAWRRIGQGGTVVVEQIDLGGDQTTSSIGVAGFQLVALERIGSVELAIFRSGGRGSAASARYEVLTGSAGPTDVQVASGTLSWSAGDATARSLRIGLLDDTLNEGEETFTVRLFDGDGVTVAGQPVQVTLVDDEALGALQFTPASLDIRFPGVAPRLELVRNVAAAGPVTAYFYHTDGTSNCCAGVVTWSPGELAARPVYVGYSPVLGKTYSIAVIDPYWQEAGPRATVNLQAGNNPTPQPPSGNGGGSAGGGAFGLFDLLALLGLSGLAANRMRRLRRGACGIGALLAAAWVAPTHAGPGDLDMGFAERGRLVVQAYVPAAPPMVLQQADGKLLIIDQPTTETGTDYERLQIRRFLANGVLDSGFGQGGTLTCPIPVEYAWLESAVLQPDGKLLIGGSAYSVAGVPEAAYIARLDLTGSCGPDPTFGSAGVVAGGDAPGPMGPGPGYTQLLTLPQGDVIAVQPNMNVIDWFDSAGRRVAAPFSGGYQVALLDGVSVVVLKETGSGFRLARLLRSGYDASFGASSEAALSDMAVQRVTVDPAGRIIVCGGPEFRRFNPDGQPDPAFGTDASGRVRHETVSGVPMDSCRGLAADPNGRILAIGTDLAPAGYELQTFVLRMRPDGSLDTSIGANGAPATLRGITRPTQQWQELGLQVVGPGRGRMAWYSTGVYPYVSNVVLDQLELEPSTTTGTVGIAALEPRAMERAGIVELPVIRSGASAGTASVRYEVVAGTAGADDVELGGGTLTWAAGDTTRRVLRINLRNDALNEGEESFTVRLLDANGVAISSQPLAVTLMDDEALRVLRFSEPNLTWRLDSSPDWPGLDLLRETASPGAVTAYLYHASATDRCCEQARRWEASDFTSLPISPQLGQSFEVVVVDDEWQPAGPKATITVVQDPPPPPITPPVTPPPPGGGGSGGSSGGGGGSVGLFDLLLGCLGAALVPRMRRRAYRTFR